MVIIETNLPGVVETKTILSSLLKKRLVGCGNYWPIQSSYLSKGHLVETVEYRLVLKTIDQLVQRVLDELKKTHPYDIPWIVTWSDGQVNAQYEAWLKEEINAQ